MKKIYFAIALHFHQPIGNFENILERAFNNCYKPLLELLSNYPEIKAMIHISGCLLDYLEKKQPDSMSLVKYMATRRQIELMGGGYYEPILVAIPERDIKGQIKMMSEYLVRKFDQKPNGIWIAERVWHPDLVNILSESQVKYIILDGEHLTRSGVPENNIHGYFIAKNGKDKLAVFPSDKKLRYLIPFKPHDEILNYFREALDKNHGKMLFTYGDDAEKFGEWPGTHDWVFGQKWLSNFFDMLCNNKDWIETVHFSDYLKSAQPTKTLSINPGSYEEMMEWSDGNWLNFLKKYPETNQLHKKMSYLSSEIEKAEKTAKTKKDRDLLEKTRREMFKGQCNCGYWHGVFGGLYLYHLRSALYHHLINAEKLLDSAARKNADSSIHAADFYDNSKKQIVLESKNTWILADPDDGGTIKELDNKKSSFNLVNTLSRKKEAYHEKILHSVENENQDNSAATIHDDFRSVDPSFKNMLLYDRFARSFFRTYLVSRDFELSDLSASNNKEIGNFSNNSYSWKIDDNALKLSSTQDVSGISVSLDKTLRLNPKDNVLMSCSVKRHGKRPINALLGIEFNLTMPDLNSDRYGYASDNNPVNGINESGTAHPVSSFGISDSHKKLGIRFDFSNKPKQVLYFPVRTVSQSERAYELNYQCSCILPVWELDFGSGPEFEVTVNMLFE